MSVRTGKPNGRPSKFTQEIADEFCRRLTNGESARTICKSEHMPDVVTVMSWLLKPEFAQFRQQYKEAREMQAELYADEIADIARNGLRTEVKTTKRVLVNGEMVVVEDSVKEHDNVQRAALIISTAQWTAARLRPKVYGDFVKKDVTDEADGESATKVVHHDAPPDPLLKPKE